MEGKDISGVINKGMYFVKDYEDIPFLEYNRLYEKALSKFNKLKGLNIIDFVDNNKVYNKDEVISIISKWSDYIDDRENDYYIEKIKEWFSKNFPK